MKKILIIAILVSILTACKSYIQVYETKSTNTETEKGFFVYENDSIKIIYSFWGDKGLISFSIYNKLNIPLYIDWKKSSYIQNSLKLNYWEDAVVTTKTSINHNYYYNGPYIEPGYTVGKSVTNSVSKAKKAERITFIPPSSNYYRTQFYILPNGDITVDNSFKTVEVKRIDNPNKTTKLQEKSFSIENSPLVFRNYLTLSYSEKFESDFSVDNKFYISKVIKMDRKVFFQWKLDKDDEWVETSLYERGDVFYIAPKK